MKRFWLLAAMLPAFAAAPALAQEESSLDTDSQSVDINGFVSRLCVLGAPSDSSIELNELVNTSGLSIGRLRTISNQVVTLPGSFCNFAGSAVTVDASALLAADASTPPTGFARAVNFTATASGWAAANAAATTAATAAGATPTAEGTGGTQAEPKLGDITLTVSAFNAPGDSLLVAGNYAGQVVITLGPVAVAD